jgi:hypothetical protein
MVVAGDSWVDIASELGCIVDSVEVEFLALISHINDPTGMLLLGPIAHSSDVSGVITIATI